MSRIVKQLAEGKFLFFFTSWLCVSICYLPAYKAGFVGEFVNYLQSFEHNTFLEFINRKEAYVISFYQLSTFIRYVCIALFGVQPIPWFLTFTACHALCGTLVYSFFSSLFRDFKLQNASLIAAAGTALFLFNPNITEVTIWKGCDHYYISVLLHLANMLLIRSFLLSGKTKYALYAALVFVLSAFALEIFYIIPIITLLLSLGYSWRSIISKERLQQAIKQLFLPQIILFIIYLVSFKLIHGSWIAHYGTTDEFVWSFADILKGYGKYILYLGIMLGHFPETIRLSIYSILQLPLVYTLIVILISAYLIIGTIRFRKLSINGQLLLFVIGLFVCSITLCLTTPFDNLFSIYNSRRCYHAGIFFYMAIALLIFSIKQRKLALLLFTAYLLVCGMLTAKMIFRWRYAANIQYGLLRNFKWQNARKVILLNVPTYFKDIRMIHANKENEFADQLRYWHYAPIKGSCYNVLGYNMNHKWDGAHVVVEDSLQIKVILNQWGSWWMYGTLGATEYENELYSVKLTDPGHEYLLRFKSKPDSSTSILFQQGDQWRKVDMGKAGEQW